MSSLFTLGMTSIIKIRGAADSLVPKVTDSFLVVTRMILSPLLPVSSPYLPSNKRAATKPSLSKLPLANSRYQTIKSLITRKPRSKLL